MFDETGFGPSDLSITFRQACTKRLSWLLSSAYLEEYESELVPYSLASAGYGDSGLTSCLTYNVLRWLLWKFRGSACPANKLLKYSSYGFFRWSIPGLALPGCTSLEDMPLVSATSFIGPWSSYFSEHAIKVKAIDGFGPVGLKYLSLRVERSPVQYFDIRHMSKMYHQGSVHTDTSLLAAHAHMPTLATKIVFSGWIESLRNACIDGI